MLIAAVDFVTKPVVGFVRLMRPLAVDIEHADVHVDGHDSDESNFARRRQRLVRFIFVIFGPKDRADDCHNMGHAMAALMNTFSFRRQVESIEHKLDVIRVRCRQSILSLSLAPARALLAHTHATLLRPFLSFPVPFPLSFPDRPAFMSSILSCRPLIAFLTTRRCVDFYLPLHFARILLTNNSTRFPLI